MFDAINCESIIFHHLDSSLRLFTRHFNTYHVQNKILRKASNETFSTRRATRSTSRLYPALYNCISHAVSFSRPFLLGRVRTHRTHVQVALFAQRRIREECTYEGERATYHIRELVWPPAPGLTPPARRPTTLRHPLEASAPRRSSPSLTPPSTHHPRLFLGGSSIAPNHPHLPSCLSPSPWKPPKASMSLWPNISFSLGPASLSLRLHSLFGSLHVRVIKLFARGPLFEPSIEINFYDLGVTLDVALAFLLLLWSSPPHFPRTFPPLYTRSCWKGIPIALWCLHFRFLSDTRPFIGVIGIFTAFHLCFGVLLGIERDRPVSISFRFKSFSSLSAAFKDTEVWFLVFLLLSSSRDIQGNIQNCIIRWY